MKESKDILSLFEALNNHEVFTPPRIARSMLDQIPDEVWRDPSARILDPATKSGVFLREAMYRLFKGLEGLGKHKGHDGIEYDLNDRQQRINHILKNMLFGIATSELTGYVSRRTLYGVMEANTDKQIASIESFERSSNFQDWSEDEKWAFIGRNNFNDYYDHTLFNVDEYLGFEREGNIFYPAAEVSIKVLDEGYEVEDTYYPFIESETQHQKILDIKGGTMKFDVIIGNPPYQISDAGESTGASPIYHKFVEQAKAMKPKYLSMIIPSRWMAGGKGLNTFRKDMLTDKHISHVVDFQDAADAFPGVEIKGGVCFFLRNAGHKGECEVTSVMGGEKHKPMVRSLSAYDVFIRMNESVAILEKVLSKGEQSFSEQVSRQKPFGFRTFFKALQDSPFPGAVKLYGNKAVGYIERDTVIVNNEWIDKHKVLLSAAYNGGYKYPHQIIGNPIQCDTNTCCTETYVVCGLYDSANEAENLYHYMRTRFFRFMVFLRKISQHNPRDRFFFAPALDMRTRWTDELLYKRYGITKPEQIFIESMIRGMA